MQRKAFVLLSGGLDSTTALYLAYEESKGNVEAVSVDYGQRHKKEMEYAAKICKLLGIKHTTISLGGLLSGSGVMLTDSSVAVPDISYADIRGVSPTYVPFRNGTMLASITALAQKYVTEQITAWIAEAPANISNKHTRQEGMQKARDLCAIYAGMHAEDALNWAYPDCSFEFLGSMANAIQVGTYYTVRLVVPFVFSSKADVVRAGMRVRVNGNPVPYKNTWSCYKGEELHCGTCPTCRSRKEAFQSAGFSDPTEYSV